jgi:hypothetical protein
VEGGVAVPLGEAGGEGAVAQGDGEDDGTPRRSDGEVTAALAAGLAEAVAEFLVGADLEQGLAGGELGVVVPPWPGAEGVGGVQSPKGRPRASEVKGERGRC